MGGDAVQYTAMSSAQAFTITTNAAGLNATYGIFWDNKTFKMDSAGTISLLENEETATPTATAKGSIPIGDNSVQKLRTYRDSSGDDIIYASSLDGLWAHDYANTKWLQTELKLPGHPTGGKGFTVWHDAALVSAGLSVKKYSVTDYAQIDNVGLDTFDGLPQLRGGDIVDACEGYNEAFFVIDSTYEGATSRSTLMGWNDKSWHVWWEAAADNINMYSCYVTDVYDYRVWFSTSGGTYYIIMQENISKPKKVSGYTYSTAGTEITPWFDANWYVGNKLAHKFKIDTDDCTATETVIVKYRLNHTYTDIASGWTTLGTIITDGTTTYDFGSSLGVAFKAIQFRFDLARGATTTTSPIIRYHVLEYSKIIPKRWGFEFVLDITKDYDGQSSQQMLDDLVTVAELETLVPFVFDETTYYVSVKTVDGTNYTGETREGEYKVFVTEV